MKRRHLYLLAGVAVAAYVIYKRQQGIATLTDANGKSLTTNADGTTTAPLNFDTNAAIAAKQAANYKRLATLATDRANKFNAAMARMGNPVRVVVPQNDPFPQTVFQ